MLEQSDRANLKEVFSFTWWGTAAIFQWNIIKRNISTVTYSSNCFENNLQDAKILRVRVKEKTASATTTLISHTNNNKFCKPICSHSQGEQCRCNIRHSSWSVMQKFNLICVSLPKTDVYLYHSNRNSFVMKNFCTKLLLSWNKKGCPNCWRRLWMAQRITKTYLYIFGVFYCVLSLYPLISLISLPNPLGFPQGRTNLLVQS